MLAAALKNDLTRKVGCKAAQGGGGFVGGIMKNHETNRGEVG